MQSKVPSKTGRLCEWAENFLVVGAVVAAGVGLIRTAPQVPPPFQMDYGEGHLLALAERIARGQGAYPDPTEPPYALNPYGPVAVHLVAGCVRLFGVGFTAPRILVVLCGVCCAALLALLVRHWGGGVAFVFGLLYLTRPVVQDWLPRLRVDLIGLAFALAGVYVFVRWRRWYISVPVFLAAVFCKMTLVAAPAACLLHAVVTRERDKALRFGASAVVLGAAIFLWAQRVTSGWFGFHTFWLNAGQPYSWHSALRYLRPELKHAYWLIALSLATAWYSRTRPALWLPVIYLGFSSLSLLAVGKLGGNFNYFLEWEAALCLCAGLGYSLLRAQCPPRGAAPLFLALIVGVLVVSGIRVRHLAPNRRPDFSGCTQAYDYVRAGTGARILSENVGALLLAGKSPLVLDPFIWTRGVLRWGIPDAEVIHLLRSRKIDLIVLGSEVKSLEKDSEMRRWPPAVLSAVEENYTLTNQFNCMDAGFFYKPTVLR